MKNLFFKNYTLICSFLVGIFFAISWKSYLNSKIHQNYPQSISYQRSRFYQVKKSKEEEIIFQNKIIPNVSCHFKKLSLLCLIFSKSSGASNAVKLTWSKRCNYSFFYGTFQNDSIPVIKYNPSSSATYFCKILFTLWDKYKEKFDWLFIATDYIFALIDNLQQYICALDSKQVYYLGRPVKVYHTPIYNVHESGIVLSKGAVDVIIHSLINSSYCGKLNHPLIGQLNKKYDINIAIILQLQKHYPFDTRDALKRARFLAFSPEKHLLPNQISYFNPFWRNNLLPFLNGHQCCSNQAITLPRIFPLQMHFYEFLLYHFVKVSDQYILKNPPSAQSSSLSPS